MKRWISLLFDVKKNGYKNQLMGVHKQLEHVWSSCINDIHCAMVAFGLSSEMCSLQIILPWLVS